MPLGFPHDVASGVIEPPRHPDDPGPRPLATVVTKGAICRTQGGTSSQHPRRGRSSPRLLTALIGCLAVVIWSPAIARSEDGSPRPRAETLQAARSFGEVVRACFAAWDLNHDGRLESVEIDALMPRQSIRGEAAAALATIKLREREVRATERPHFAISLEQLTNPQADEGEAHPVDAARKGLHHFRYESHYRRNLGVLATLVRRLYAGRGPNFQVMRQGPIGDCYFFSLTGYLAARTPQKIAHMIQPQADGHYLVRFGNGVAVRVPNPSEAEVLVNNSSSSLEDGLWLPVLEKALGMVMRARASAPKRTAEATDAMASGGPTPLIIHLYSGHRSHRISLRAGRDAPLRIATLRRSLPEVLARGMLAGLNMDHSPPHDGKKIPGLGYNHSYAILAYDPRTDLVTIWNPWGNTFHPKGPEGVEHGFVTEHGVFRMPLTTLYQQFSEVHLETFEMATARR
ncbi:MAG: hypothetical protein IRY99_04980 [Isosphaeraceae bacterium]|nr:hypothetical protein [Isosphaeraceae bacterium]